jgi:hypothetical protein
LDGKKRTKIDMEKIIWDLAWDTSVKMTPDEAKEVCRLGQQAGCCAFLTVGEEGFTCERMNSRISTIILDRLEKGTMNAKGEGGWAGCAWEGKLAAPHPEIDGERRPGTMPVNGPTPDDP